MKIRTGFVSNSSSASFSIKIGDLTDDQLNRIKNAVKDKKENAWGIVDLFGYLDVGNDHWSLMIYNGTIIADTFCNNGDIEEFFKALSIPEEKIDFWDESDEPWDEEEDED